MVTGGVREAATPRSFLRDVGALVVQQIPIDALAEGAVRMVPFVEC
jgi:hypothetical protein